MRYHHEKLIFSRNKNMPLYENKDIFKGGIIMNNTINIEDFRKETKKREFKEKLNSKIQRGKEWFVRNREAIIYLTPIVIGGAATIAKVVGKRVNLRKQEELKDLYCYDRSLGHYWRLRRELTNKEWLEIDQRKKNVERLSDILSEMKVLK